MSLNANRKDSIGIFYFIILEIFILIIHNIQLAIEAVFSQLKVIMPT